MIDKSKHSKLIRLNKYIADCGIASRRKADQLIMDGKVEVNGRVCITLGTTIDPNEDKIFVNGKQVLPLDNKIYILFNKPKDCITTTSDEKGRRTILDYIRIKKRVYPIGRLDRDTTGVLLLTNDGEFANILMHPKYEIKKSYKVQIDKPITPEDAKRLSDGIKLSDGVTSPAEVYIIPGKRNKEIGIIIHEGKNKQVRRMFEALGYVVKKLDRVAYGEITYEGLRRGEWRYLNKKEIESLKKYFKGVRI